MSFHRSEPIPVVGVAPDAAPTTCIEISEAWVPILVGLAEFMLWPGFWSGTEEEVDEAFSHSIQLAGLLMGGECTPVHYANLYHQTPGDGGGAVVGWNIRTLTHAHDPSFFVTLEDNVFTMEAGTYIIQATAPAFGVSVHQLRLWNVDLDSLHARGIATVAKSGIGARGGSLAYLSTLTDVPADAPLRLDHYCGSAVPIYGLGVSAGSGIDNIYTNIEIFRVPAATGP